MAHISQLLCIFAAINTRTQTMKPRLLSVICLMLASVALWAQGPNQTGKYYRPADGKTGEELKTALFDIIREPNVVSYDGLKQAYVKTDTRADGYLRDFYSDITQYVPGSDMAAGQYEGYSYNREHAVCQSWFKSVSPMYSDIVMVIPTDGYINSRRNDNPFGEVVTNAANVNASQTGYSKWGAPKADLGQPAAVTTVFEPNDEVKGDIARIYLYMATCYQDRATKFVNGKGEHVFNANGTTYQPLQQWVFNLMMKWSKQDPVDEVERARNNAVKEVQGNRNPFVDYPGLEDYIWGDKKDKPFSYDYYEGVKQGDDMGDDPDVEPIGEMAVIPLNNTFFDTTWTGARPTGKGEPTQIVGKMGNVTVTYAKGTSGQSMYCNNTHIRLYKYNLLTFRITGDEFTKIEFKVLANANNKQLSASNGTMDGYTWTGETDEVVFKLADTENGNMQIGSATVYTPKKESAGIETITPTTSDERMEAVYTMDGRRVKKLQKGVHIVRMNNGDVMKVLATN